MKKLILHSLLFSACFTLFAACSKDVKAPSKTSSTATTLKFLPTTTAGTTTTQNTTDGCTHSCGGSSTCGGSSGGYYGNY